MAEPSPSRIVSAGAMSCLAMFALRGFWAAARELAAGRRDEALLAYMEPVSAWAYELGPLDPRTNPTDRPQAWWRAPSNACFSDEACEHRHTRKG